MNRKEIKSEAWKKIDGNKWNIWWPALVIGFISSILTSIAKPAENLNIQTFIAEQPELTPGQLVVLIIGAIFSGLAMAGYMKYLINFVRTGKFDSNDIIEAVKEKWLDILIAIILVSIIVSLCTCLLVIPGIIMALAYSFVIFIIVDKGTKGQDALKASREMMKGYKWDYFVFMLSFIRWVILIPFTLGILAIWVVPYMTIAEVIYYDKLQKLKK